MPDLLERLKAVLTDRYAVESEVGRGGMAVVYLAEDLRHHRQVAIKVLHPELTATLGAERFLREIEIIAGLQHPHILPLYESGETDGLLFYVMPYAEGESLRQRLDREGQLAVDESVRIAVEVADGLEYAHLKGVVHRDIKPGNILLSSRHAVIADFGIARAIEAARQKRITSTGLGVGTPLYASPEQVTAQETLDGRTDIYSLGCMLYEMLAGEPPLSGATPEMIQARRVSETPSSLNAQRNTVPPALDEAIARALAPVPADRYATAAQFGQALQAAVEGTTPTTHLEFPPSRRRLTPDRLRHVGLRIVPASALVLLGAWLIVQRVGERADPAEPAREPLRQVQLTYEAEVELPAISPDGRYLAFAMPAETGNTRRIIVRDLERIEPERLLAEVDDPRNLNWRPDGSAVVFRGSRHGQMGWYQVGRTGGSVASLGGSGELSPDGSEVLSWERDRDYVLVFSSDRDRTDSTGRPEVLDSIPIAGEHIGITDVEYSPGGDYLTVATSSSAGGGSIWSVSRDGEDQKLLANTAVLRNSLLWRADGRVLYFITELTRGRQALMKLVTSSTSGAAAEPELLIEVRERTHRARYITADGLHLVEPRSTNEQRIVRLRGSDLRVEPISGTEGTSFFEVSPDGRSIAFLLRGDVGMDIFGIPIEGGRPQQLTTGGTVSRFGWSPDSRVIAFSARWGDSLTIRLVPATGGSPVPLAGSRTDGLLNWSQGPLIYRRPDGRFWVADSIGIRIGSDLLPLTPENMERLGGVAEARGRPLASNDSLGAIVPHLINSPDGRWVAARWTRPDEPGLWKFSLTDSTQTPVRLDTRSRQYTPVGWTLDGEAIFCLRSISITLKPEFANDSLFSVPAEGGEPDLVLSPPEENAYFCDPYYEDGELTFVCVEILSLSSDAWLIENFDPH